MKRIAFSTILLAAVALAQPLTITIKNSAGQATSTGTILPPVIAPTVSPANFGNVAPGASFTLTVTSNDPNGITCTPTTTATYTISCQINYGTGGAGSGPATVTVTVAKPTASVQWGTMPADQMVALNIPPPCADTKVDAELDEDNNATCINWCVSPYIDASGKPACLGAADLLRDPTKCPPQCAVDLPY